jgi:hypothetical protein
MMDLDKIMREYVEVEMGIHHFEALAEECRERRDHKTESAYLSMVETLKAAKAKLPRIHIT